MVLISCGSVTLDQTQLFHAISLVLVCDSSVFSTIILKTEKRLRYCNPKWSLGAEMGVSVFYMWRVYCTTNFDEFLAHLSQMVS